MTVTVANLPYDFCPTAANGPVQGFMFKNGYDAWFYNNATATATQITDKDFPGYHAYTVGLTSSGTVATATMPSLSMTSITSSIGLATATTAAAHGLTTGDIVKINGAGGTQQVITSLVQAAGTATATFAAAHGYTVGQVIVIAGATPAAYNGAHTLLSVTTSAPYTFTFAVDVNTSTPATYLTPAIPATPTTPAVPAVDITASSTTVKTASSLTQSNGIATFTTATAHGLETGNTVTIAGVTDAQVTPVQYFTAPLHDTYGDMCVVAIVSATTGYAVGDILTLSSDGAQACKVYDGDYVVAEVGTNSYLVNLPLGSAYLSYHYVKLTKVSGVISYVNSIQGVASGDVTPFINSVDAVYAISSARMQRKYSDYNGIFTITVTSPTTFTYFVSNRVPATATGTATAALDFSAYNGIQTVTVTSTTTFTYIIAGTPPATATGTITYQTTHGFALFDSVTIAGATPAAYNGTYSVTGVQSFFFTYTFAGGTSPATGTITATGGKHTVPGIVFLDGYFVVMDDQCRVWNSELNDATQWSALNFLSSQTEPGNAVALGKTAAYIVTFKEWSTEMLYDAGNPVGSPFSHVQNGFMLIGCASGASVANVDGVLFWMSQTKQKGRGVYMMSGLEKQQISTPDIERILNLSTLATVYSYGFKIAGHTFYLLTLTDRNLTLVYDVASKTWAQWSSLTLGTPVSVTSITLSGTTATVTTGAAHNLTDGDPVYIAGANQGAYNGIKVISYTDATHYTFETTAGTTTPATGTITSTPFTETYFKYTKYINAFGKDLVQHETNGTLCELTESAYSDVGNPVNVVIRTGKIDGGTELLKRYASVSVIGNKVSGTAYLRHSDDDYVTNTVYRPVSLSATRSIIRRCGAARRRSYELRYLDNTALQVVALDLEVS